MASELKISLCYAIRHATHTNSLLVEVVHKIIRVALFVKKKRQKHVHHHGSSNAVQLLRARLQHVETLQWTRANTTTSTTSKWRTSRDRITRNSLGERSRKGANSSKLKPSLITPF